MTTENKKLEEIKIAGIKIYLIKDTYLYGDDLIIVKKGDYNKLLRLGEEYLRFLAKIFDDGFYINDGYELEIRNREFYFRYDHGSREIPIEEVDFQKD